MKSKIAAAVLLAMVGLAGVSHADPIEFKVAAIGTRYYKSSGGYFDIAKIDGTSVQTVNQDGRPYDWIGMFVGRSNASAYQFSREKVESIWPLEIGKVVQFDMSGAASKSVQSSAWSNELRVLRAEKIKIPAGEFDTIVVEWIQRGVQGGGLGFLGTTNCWYAPQAGFVVKVVQQQETGGTNRLTNFEVTRIEPPK